MTAHAEESKHSVRLTGVGINVSDIARSEKFYTEVLGLKVAMRQPAQGETRELVLSDSGDLKSTLLVLAKLDDKPLAAGRTEYGRVILNPADAASIAKRAEKAGFKPKKLEIPGGGPGPIVYFLEDPDGYHVELYQPPTGGQQP